MSMTLTSDTAEAVVTAPLAPCPPAPSYLLIREALAPKLGSRSQGKITYQVLTDEARHDLFLRIAHNDGGGYVSDEAVPLNKLRSCINQRASDQPMRSAIFMAAFKGRSSNNPTFAAAVMINEGLLSRDPQRPGVLMDVDGWPTWAASQLAIEGDLPLVTVGKVPPAAVGLEPVHSESVGESAPESVKPHKGRGRQPKPPLPDDA